MRSFAAAAAAVLTALAGAACSSEEPSTSGPPASMVHLGLDGVRVHAVHHKLSLADLPVARLTGGVPAIGTIEVGAGVHVPLDAGGPDLRGARGKLAFRCLGACQLGDDVARLAVPTTPAMDAFAPDGIPFSHLDLTGLEAHVLFAGGHARITEWKLASADLDLDVEADVTLGRTPASSTIDGCVRFRPTDALRARDPKLHSLLSLAAGPRDITDRYNLKLTGRLTDPRITPGACSDVDDAP